MTGIAADPGIASAAILACLAGAGLLSAVRLTLARASRPRIAVRDDEDEAAPGARHRPPLIRSRVLGGLLVGNIVLNVAGTALATASLLALKGPRGALYAGLAVSVLIILAEALARLAVSRGVLRRAARLIGLPLEDYAERLSATDEIRGQVESLHQSGGVVKEERDMLGGLLDLKELAVSDVMVHRTNVRMLDAELPANELVRDVLASPHTRLPLWRGDPDNIVGVLHAKDLLRAVAARGPGAPVDLEAVATLPWFVPEATTLRDQLTAFLSRKQHFALVVDEYGGLMGLVTLEDILEEIVGEISDEHDVAASGIRLQPDGSVLVDGSVPIRDLNRTMDWSLPDDEATTVAGLVIHEVMAIPEAGQVFTFHGCRFEVVRRVRNRVAALRVAPQRAAGERAGDEPVRAA